MKNKKWFSFVEIIISVSIIILLSLIAFNSQKWLEEKSTNAKVEQNWKSISNSLNSYIQENWELPMPWWNVNFFGADTTYMHSYEDPNTFWVYGSLTEETLPKRNWEVLPLDPRTNSYYFYWKTKAWNQFEVASVQVIDWTPIAKVVWNYTAEN